MSEATQIREPASAAGFLARGGEMGALMRSMDWSGTALGSLESWPQSLRTSVSICLNSRFPMILWWGPELTVLYNDPYIPILGTKHPKRALGLPGAEVWAEVWPVIEPLLMRVMNEGEANWADDLLLFINRLGYPEECYFRFSYSPISNESGGIGGVFTPVSETTQKVVAERRLSTLRELAGCGSRSKSAVQACQSLAEAISRNAFDIPFGALYLVDRAGEEAELMATAGVERGTGVSPETIDLRAGGISPLAKAVRAGSIGTISDLSHFGELPSGPWGDSPSALVVLAVSLPGQNELVAVLVAGVSARKHLDADYQSFFELVGQQIGTAVSAARAYEEEKRRAESLAELDRAKTTFFSNVSHEFRTPLTLMRGPLEEVLAENSELSTETRDQLSVAYRNALRLEKMVNTLLDFSRIEAGRIKATYEETDLARFTADVASTFRSLIESAGLQLLVECVPVSEPVWVDREMWEKVVLNLISNAFKFTFAGSITVRLEEGDGRVELSVIDTGTGIPAAELPHIFERFHRIEGAHGRTQEGTGIGLAMVSELVSLHGGTVEVESRPGAGSKFMVSVPLGTFHLPADRLRSAGTGGAYLPHDRYYLEEASRWLARGIDQRLQDTEPPAADAPREGRVLLVDDNSDMREYLSRLLAADFEVTTAANGKQAFERAIADPPDLILSDIMMPELDGFGLIEALRANASTCGIPVILLSARAGEESRSEGMNAGADDYLVKPFSGRELTARVRAHLKLSGVRRQAELRESKLRSEAEAARDHAASVLESITNGFYSLDQNWRFTYVNRMGEKLMGATREELIGKTIWDIYPGIHDTKVYPEYQRAIRDQVAVEFEEVYAPWQKWFAVNVYPTDAGGLAVYFRDITENKRAEEALRESEKRFRQLADNMSQFAWMADETGAIFWYNQRWYDYTGTTLEEMQGSGLRKIHHPEYESQVVSRYFACVKAGEMWEDTFPLRGKNGEWRWFLSRARPIRDEEGRIVRWFGTNTDVTEQLETERDLRRANQDLEQFAFTASHDLQEPLRNVAIYSQLLKKRAGSSLGEESEQFLSYIVEGAQRMGNLISDLLAYTQAGILDVQRIEPVEAESVLDQVVSNLSQVIAEARAEIRHKPLPALAVKEAHLQQLLQNLIGNAIKYRRDDAAPCIEVSAVRADGFWQLSVQDNGIGIPPQFHEKVFGIFKRLHPNSGKYSGTGIGLAICQRIVERYGGRIWLESGVGLGTTFHFTLPSTDRDETTSMSLAVVE